MNKTQFDHMLAEERRSEIYKRYERVREAIWRMSAAGSGAASIYWTQELAGLDYLSDASPLIVRNLRHHAYHLTGLKEYEYRSHHAHQAGKFKAKLELLRRADRRGLCVPESPALGGFGHSIEGSLYNTDTLKFYECLIALDRAGIVERLAATGRRNVVLEIGAGWGGFAYQYKMLFPNTTYVIVDFPEVLLFAGTYLANVFPDAACYFMESGNAPERVGGYDFVFVPHYFWDALRFPAPDLLVNICSFQEMTTSQAERYIRRAAEWGIPSVYSLNRDRSPHNTELTTVSAVMAERYAVRNIDALPMQYTDFPEPVRLPTLASYVRDVLRRVRRGPTPPPSVHRYRHLLGDKKSV